MRLSGAEVGRVTAPGAGRQVASERHGIGRLGERDVDRRDGRAIPIRWILLTRDPAGASDLELSANRNGSGVGSHAIDSTRARGRTTADS